ncbi:MAG: hypothetical protein ABL866_17610, partial [Devosia sp.]
LVAAGFIPDASYLWWAIRPSVRFPTLELRIADSCTRIRDSAIIAAIYQSLLHYLARNPESFREWEDHHRLINEENVWQAVRHGIDARFANPVTGEVTVLAAWADELVALLAGSARELGCTQELSAIADIAMEGSSADRQLNRFQSEIASGATKAEALKFVAEDLADLTMCGALAASIGDPIARPVYAE